jgi:tight adherence protein B
MRLGSAGPGPGSPRRVLRLALAGAALAALSLPAVAVGQAGAPTLKDAPDTGFPDRQYLLQLPSPRTLESGDVTVTENGSSPSGQVGVEAPGSGTSGSILLIDASESMEGEPIQGAMAAARAFLPKRPAAMPVAIVSFHGEQTELSGFTTDAEGLSAAVANAPALAYGTEIYDTLVQAAEMATSQGLARSTVVLISDGTDVGSESTRAEALAALDAANVRVISVGLDSPQYDPDTLRSLAQNTGGTYVETATPAELAPVFEQIGTRLSSEYLITYRSVLPPTTPANVRATVAGLPAATASYTTPELVIEPRGTFESSWIDDVITSPFLLIFVVLSVLALLVFAVLTGLDVRSRSVRKRMAQYVSVPTEDESRQRRAEVAGMLAERAQRKVEGHRWWQSFESDVELAGFKATAVTIAGWTMLAGILTSIVVAVVFQSLLGLFAGLVAPFITRAVVKRRITKLQAAFAEELPDNLEVLAGALRAGHSLIGAMGVMVDGATEPSKSEFRRVLQDEQLGVPLDDALMVMSRRMDNLDVEQVAIVTRLQREAGGNTAEVLDRVVENIRGRMELRRLVRVLTAQGRIARYILTAIPIVLLVFFFSVNKVWLEPLWMTGPGRFALGTWVVLLISGWFAIKKIVEIEV